MTTTPLHQALTDLLSQTNAECASDTPDFLLAQFLVDVLDAWNTAVRARAAWRQRGPQVEDGRTFLPVRVPTPCDVRPTLGRVAYEAYASKVLLVCAWDELLPEIQSAWDAAAQAVWGAVWPR